MTRFIRMMTGNSRDYGKNVGGSNRPFFCLQFSRLAVITALGVPENKKGPSGPFVVSSR
ncbi:hypothetical protein IAE35_18805 [Pseudomonas sp. S75]|uniref:hypothetical protein n=1 Tax=Pseudomonas sp. S75 TaxID=2767446 RepID=UPI00190AC9A1|nr:hypothetical protein [Pseudomonas sp. S75]MBK0155397.1 hypothetical protein [Pseudomonas sp. S75]